MQKIISYILMICGAIGVAVMAGFTIFFKGKKEGREEVVAKQNEEILETVDDTKKALDKRANDSIDVKRARVLKHKRD